MGTTLRSSIHGSNSYLSLQQLSAQLSGVEEWRLTPGGAFDTALATNLEDLEEATRGAAVVNRPGSGSANLKKTETGQNPKSVFLSQRPIPFIKCPLDAKNCGRGSKGLLVSVP